MGETGRTGEQGTGQGLLARAGEPGATAVSQAVFENDAGSIATAPAGETTHS